MRELAERTYFEACRALGRLLRSARYSTSRAVAGSGQVHVRKHRLFYAPVLVRLGGPLVRILNTGVRVLAQREWEERERRLYPIVHGASVRIDAGGALALPRLPGTTLAALLADPALAEPVRRRALALAVRALADFHRLGFTHGDAMAENVLVDLDGGAAHWFDFETVHDPDRPMDWRRADDVRALLMTVLLRVRPDARADALQLIMDDYGDDGVGRLVAASFGTIVQRPLAFHLGQAHLSLEAYRQIARLLKERFADRDVQDAGVAHS